LGIDMPVKESPVMKRSANFPSRTAPTRPALTPTSSQSTAAPTATVAETGIRCAIISNTGWLVWKE
jgi:hypothetical protein